MTVLRRLKKDLQDAADYVLPLNAEAERSFSGASRRSESSAGTRVLSGLVATVSIAIAIVVVLSLCSGRNPGGRSAGAGSPCQVSLTNTALAGQVAPVAATSFAFQTHALAANSVTWPQAHATKTFTSCPPTRALLVGDSIAFNIGVPLLSDEQKYNTALSDAAILSCAFGVRGQVNINGKWVTPSTNCQDELAIWDQSADAFGANEIIVELGYLDEFNWRWNGQIVHLGQSSFDSYVAGRIRELINTLGANGARKILLLSVPVTDPAPLPGGQPAPQAAEARHAEINRLISQAAETAGNTVGVLDIDTWLSPNGTYQSSLGQRLCRFDGVHLTPYCAHYLEPHVYDAAAKLP